MAAYAGTQLMAVQVPQGCYAGQLLQIQAPNGQLMQVQIPQGIGPGQQFQVRLPTSIEIPEIPQPSHQQPQHTPEEDDPDFQRALMASMTSDQHTESKQDSDEEMYDLNNADARDHIMVSVP